MQLIITIGNYASSSNFYCRIRLEASLKAIHGHYLLTYLLNYFVLLGD